MDRERVARRVDRLLDRADVPAHELECLLQARAQDMRELAYAEGDAAVIDPADCERDE